MHALAPCGDGLDLELKLAALQAHVECLTASGALQAAHQAAAQLFATATAAGLQVGAFTQQRKAQLVSVQQRCKG